MIDKILRSTHACHAGATWSVFVAFLISCSSLIMADVVIELKDGQHIVVPVDEKDVERITFSSNKDEAATAVVSPKLSSQVVWQVGPERVLKYPSEAARKARDGDIIEIDAGVYHNDYVKWKQNALTIRGVGGMAHVKSQGLIPNGKGIWIIKGASTVIENVEFSGAKVKSTNGTGIRHEGGDLTLRNTFFHDNEFSQLAGKSPDVSLDIIASRFWFQKRENTYSHGMYIGAIKRFTLIGSHVKGTDKGNQIKSRALENHILYNRIEDVPGGNSSRLIDLSNCVLSFIIGNDMHQAASTQNNNAIGYGPEKCIGRTERQMKLYVINNTFINEASNGTLVNNHAAGEVLVANNLLLGAGKFLLGKGTETNNKKADLSKRQPGSWAPPPGSAAIDGSTKLSMAEGVSLIPTEVFTLPVGTVLRTQSGPLDIGSRERAKQ